MHTEVRLCFGPGCFYLFTFLQSYSYSNKAIGGDSAQ